MEQGDDGFKRTVAGLLRKRAELLNEMTETRERVAQISTDIETVERCLALCGYDGELKTQKQATRVVLYYRNELRSFITKQLEAAGDLTSRDLAERLIETEGRDPKDRRLRSDIIRRVSSCLSQMRNHGIAVSERKRGALCWRLAPA